MVKENIDLAKKHIEIAEQIISEECSKKKTNDKRIEKEFIEAQFALEKADSEVSDLEKVD